MRITLLAFLLLVGFAPTTSLSKVNEATNWFGRTNDTPSIDQPLARIGERVDTLRVGKVKVF